MSAFDPKTQLRESAFASRDTRPPSVFSSASIDTLVADTSYRGYPSEEAYLQALKEWAQSKMSYYENKEVLLGWYGRKTADEYLAEQKLERQKYIKARRPTVDAAKLPTLAERRESTSSAMDMAADKSTANKKENKLKKVFSRRKSVD